MPAALAIGLDRRSMWVLCAAALAVGGCGGSEETEPGASTTTGGPGPPPVEGCPPGEVTKEDGTCRPPGIPDDGCAPGFEHDGRGGCDAVLPAEPCAEGQMALPGETACRDVAPCGAAKFGDAEGAPGTQYVDADYAGSDSDGSEARPWTTIQKGVDAAGPGAVVAVAAGTYASFHVDQAISVVGRCPSMVHVVGPAGGQAVLLTGEGAVLRGLGMRGDGYGLSSSAETATVDRCWIHDTARIGVYATSGSLTILDSLVEDTYEVGCGAQGGSLSLERTVVRRVRPNSVGIFGSGVVVQPGTGDLFGSLSVKSSLIEDNSDFGIAVVEGDATIDATLIRRTKPRPADETSGRGLVINDERPPDVAVLTLTRSVLEENHHSAIVVGAAEALIEATAIRDTLPLPSGEGGRGIEVVWFPTTGARASIDLRDSIIEECHSSGMALLDSDATVSGSVIRDIHIKSSAEPRGRGLEARTEAQPPQVHIRESLFEQCAQALLSSGATMDIVRTAFRDNGAELDSPQGGSGLVFQVDLETRTGSLAALRDSLLERNTYLSLTVIGSDVTVERTRVMDTRTGPDGLFGRGVHVQPSIETGDSSRFAMLDSSVERSVDAGVVVVNSEAELERVVIAETLGDGLAVVTFDLPRRALNGGAASVRLVDSRIQGSGRAGISNFGASVTISKTVLDCNAIHLDGENFSGESYSFLDEGGNACGCDGVEDDCTVASSMLEPPAAAPGL